MNRDVSLDILRGFAIVLMIFANSVGYFVSSELSVFPRLICSIAAPIFIFINAELIFQRAIQFKKVFWKSFYVLITGVFVDVFIHQIVPFSTCDVLYYLAISIIITFLTKRIIESTAPSMSLINRAVVIVLIIILSLVIHEICICSNKFEGQSPKELNIISIVQAGYVTNLNLYFHEVCNNWLYKGWFPILAWIPFTFLGIFLSILRKSDIVQTKSFFRIALATVILSSILFGIFYKAPPYRDEYVELFYPMNFLLSLYIMAIVCLCTSLFYRIKNVTGFLYPFQIIGEASLFNYIFHLFIISLFHIANKYMDWQIKIFSINRFFLVYFSFIAILFFVNQHIKEGKISGRSFYKKKFFRFLFGS